MLNERRMWPRISQQLAVVTVVACCSVLAQAAFAGEWIADGKTRCQVWNPNPTGKESLTWSGMCRDGYAEGAGIVQWFKEGLPYERNEGTWQRGRQIGHGVQTWPTGHYEGGVQNGVPHGHGLLVLGEARYEGEFSEGKPHGAGVLRSAKGVFEGVWRHGCFHDGKQKTSLGVDLSSCP
jgi:hypothetical protein